MIDKIDLLLDELNTEETLLLFDCQQRFNTIGRVVTVEGFCLEMCIRISDQITREHEMILDHIDRIEQIKEECKAVHTTKNAMMRLEKKNDGI